MAGLGSSVKNTSIHSFHMYAMNGWLRNKQGDPIWGGIRPHQEPATLSAWYPI